jgi:hypothetical protein
VSGLFSSTAGTTGLMACFGAMDHEPLIPRPRRDPLWLALVAAFIFVSAVMLAGSVLS